MGSYVRTPALKANSKPLSPDGEYRNSICSLCNGGCGLKVFLNNNGRVKAVYGDPDNPYSKGKICPKPIEVAHTLYGEDRVVYPLQKVNGKFERISWDEALGIIAEKHLDFMHKNGNGSVIGITSKVGGSYSKLALSIFSELTGLVTYGTGPICYDSESKVRKSLFGNGSGSAPLSDVIFARIILLVGNNCAQSKAGQFHWLQKARASGTKIVVIDTRYTETAQQADTFIQIKPGTDAALGMALLHLIIKNKLYNQTFVNEKTRGFRELAKAVEAYTPEKAASIMGVPQNVIEQLAYELGNCKPGMLWPGRGIVSVNNAGMSLWAFEAIMAILGNIGVPGSGIISHITGYGKTNTLIKKEDIVKSDQKRTPASIYQAMETGEIKMLYMAGNPCANWPDSKQMCQAIGNLDFVVSHTLVLDDSAMLADIVLPAAHWLEEAGAQASVHRVLQWREQAAVPFGESKTGGEFYRLLAEKMNLPMAYFPESPEEAWELERTHNPGITGITLDYLRQTPGGVHYPCREMEQETERLFIDGTFATPSGKIELFNQGFDLNFQSPIDAPGNSEVDSKRFPYYLSTVKVASHYNTGTQSSEWARVMESPCCELHPSTAAEIGVKEGEVVRLETVTGSLVLPARITLKVPKGCIYTQAYYSKQSPYQTQQINTLFPVVSDQEGGNFVNKNILCSARAEKGAINESVYNAN